MGKQPLPVVKVEAGVFVQLQVILVGGSPQIS